MGKIATYIHAIVQPGCRIEVAAPPGMREGDELEIVLLTDDDIAKRTAGKHSRTLLSILDSLSHDSSGFASAHEVDAYVRDERDSWER